MNRKIAFHPKFISIFILLLLFGIAIAPSFNGIKITKPIDNIPSKFFNYNNIEKLNNSNNLKDIYPPIICTYLGIFSLVYYGTFLLVVTAFLEGKISEDLMYKITDKLIKRINSLQNISNFLNCPEMPWDDWIDPENKLNSINSNLINKLYTFESSINIKNYSLNNCDCQKNLHNPTPITRSPTICFFLFINFIVLNSKYVLIKPIIEKLNIKVLTWIFEFTWSQRFYRITNLAYQFNCEWLNVQPFNL